MTSEELPKIDPSRELELPDVATQEAIAEQPGVVAEAAGSVGVAGAGVELEDSNPTNPSPASTFRLPVLLKRASDVMGPVRTAMEQRNPDKNQGHNLK